MQTSTRTTEVLSALMRAKAQFKPIAKTKHVLVTTKQGRSFSYDYAPLDSIQAATEPALSAEGLLLVSGGQPGADGTFEAVTRLVHCSSEQWPESRIPWSAFEDIKSLGGFISYARRFSTVALLDLVGEDDLDATLADGDHVEPRRKADKSAAAEKLRPAEPVNGNGHPPAPEVDQGLEHPTEGHIMALQSLALTECCEDKEVYYQRIRTTMGLKASASVAPKLLTRSMSMVQYMTLFEYYRRLEAQLAKTQKEATSGTTSESPAAPTITPATPVAAPPVDPPPAASAEASESAASELDAAERDRIRLRAEVAAWDLRVPPDEVEHVIQHNPSSKARALLWKCRRQDTAA